MYDLTIMHVMIPQKKVNVLFKNFINILFDFEYRFYITFRHIFTNYYDPALKKEIWNSTQTWFI